MQPIVLENLCDPDVQEQIKFEIQKDAHFRLAETTLVDPYIDTNDSNILDGPMMVCTTVDTDRPMNQFAPMSFFLCDKIADRLKIHILSYPRIKINLQFQNPNYAEKYNPPHTDSPEQYHISAVYYVNDSDGDTIIFDKCLPDDPVNLMPILRNPPKQGNAVVFSSQQFHSGSLPINHSNRIVVNIIMEISKNDYQKLFAK